MEVAESVGKSGVIRKMLKLLIELYIAERALAVLGSLSGATLAFLAIPLLLHMSEGRRKGKSLPEDSCEGGNAVGKEASDEGGRK